MKEHNPFEETDKPTSVERITQIEHAKIKTICRYTLVGLIILCVAAVISDYFKYNHQ